jgi:hypothetical protein
VTLRFAVPLRPTVGTRPVEDADWLVVDRHRTAQLAEKRRLLAERPDEVVASLPGTRSAAAEAAALVADWYGRRHPALLSQAATDATAIGDGDPTLGGDTGALVSAALTCAEDLCLMQQRDGQWRLTAAVLCFPSRWRLADKLGVGLAGIHDPVPGFAGPVAQASQQVFDRLTSDRILLRFNWSLLDDAALFQPSGPTGESPAVTDPASQLFLRIERQTLRRLPGAGAILFTIHTEVSDLGAVATDAERARELAASLRSAAPATRAYKGWGATADLAADWLDDRAAAVLAARAAGGAE